MSKKIKIARLIQLHASPDIWRRFRATPEFKLHGKVSTALRAILDRVLPTLKGNHDKVA